LDFTSSEKMVTAQRPKVVSDDHKLFQDTAFFDFEESTVGQSPEPPQHYRTDGTRGPIEPEVTAQSSMPHYPTNHLQMPSNETRHMAMHQPRKSLSSFFEGGRG